MVYVVEKTTGKILDRADAWEPYAPERLARKAVADGYTLCCHPPVTDPTTRPHWCPIRKEV